MLPSELEAAITGRTKAIVLNSPSNPTGAVYSRSELEALGKVLVKRGIAVISDEIYEKLIYDDAEHVSIASLSPELQELTVLINGVSKSYSMTGWRIGYAAAPANVAKAMADLQSHSTSNPTSFASRPVSRPLRAHRSLWRRWSGSLKSAGTTCWKGCCPFPD
jgi:aspartate aminotransferase